MEVFLGGSCNPTKWRDRVAIPILEANNIHYYNPQKSCWTIDMIEMEREAKEKAKCILFVIDKDTRSLVSMNETVEYICRNSHVVVVVVQELNDDDQRLDGVNICHEEWEELKRGRIFIQYLAKLYNVPCFSNVKSAVHGIVTWISSPKLNTPVQDTGISYCHQKEIVQRMKHTRPKSVSLIKRSSKILHSFRQHLISGRKAQDCIIGKVDKGLVYLGHSESTWQNDIVIPMLTKENIAYIDSYDIGITLLEDMECCKSQMPSKASICLSLLFLVIENTSRCISKMIQTMELVCTSQVPILLVVQDVETSDSCGREQQDLHRARCYLKEAAIRNDVPVFTTIEKATESIYKHL